MGPKKGDAAAARAAQKAAEEKRQQVRGPPRPAAPPLVQRPAFSSRVAGRERAPGSPPPLLPPAAQKANDRTFGLKNKKSPRPCRGGQLPRDTPPFTIHMGNKIACTLQDPFEVVSPVLLHGRVDGHHLLDVHHHHGPNIHRAVLALGRRPDPHHVLGHVAHHRLHRRDHLAHERAVPAANGLEASQTGVLVHLLVQLPPLCLVIVHAHDRGGVVRGPLHIPRLGSNVQGLE
mmetsp:Transcript_53117/g.168612  ORF Transcript_53117/g.168612 Transcript_53117/m.168612 type:complete len:232 (-) Transcript_53117:3368-4063(-)